MWDNMTTCWDGEISTRLQIESVTKCLTQAAETWVADTPAFLLASEAGIAHVMSLKGEEAQDFIDKFHQVTAFCPQTLVVYADVRGRL